MATFKMPTKAHIGFIALRVKDLQVMTDFYAKIVGLTILKQDQDTVYLGSEQTQTVLITLRQAPDVKRLQTPSQLAYFGLQLSDLTAFRMLWDQLQANQIELDGTYETDRDYQIQIVDPEDHIIRFTVLKSTATGKLTLDRLPITLETILPKRASVQPDNMFLGLCALGLSVRDLATTTTFYQEVLGLDLRAQKPQQSLLADTTAALQMTLTQHDDQASETSLDFVNIVLPKSGWLDTFVTHLQQQGFTDYQYLPEHHYLMFNDPAKINLCFSIA